MKCSACGQDGFGSGIAVRKHRESGECPALPKDEPEVDEEAMIAEMAELETVSEGTDKIDEETLREMFTEPEKAAQMYSAAVTAVVNEVWRGQEKVAPVPPNQTLIPFEKCMPEMKALIGTTVMLELQGRVTKDGVEVVEVYYRRRR